VRVIDVWVAAVASVAIVLVCAYWGRDDDG